MAEEIKLAHGGGGTLMADLIRREIMPALGSKGPLDFSDSARLDIEGVSLAFTTDSFVVQPLFFPGGDIGRLAVCGTVNDLATRGARPLALSLGFILEEGLPIETLRRVLQSISRAACEAGVEVVTGDTKVVERGSASGMFINTSGIGLLRRDLDYSPARIAPGDLLIVSGPIGDHGIAVVSVREGLSFVSGVESDVAPLGEMVRQAVEAVGPQIKCMKDPTRGGVAATVNEMAQNAGFVLDEKSIPVRPAVRGACEMLGFDPLTVANEGKMLFVVAAQAAERTLEVLRANPLGVQAAIIGKADSRKGLVRLKTSIGGERILETPYGEELPRIC